METAVAGVSQHLARVGLDRLPLNPTFSPGGAKSDGRVALL